MKKLAKLMALLLAGAMMLSMTGCCTAFDEDAARKVILDEINAYREKLDLEPLTECKELDDMASAYVKQFEKKKTIVLTESEAGGEEYIKCWETANEKLSLDVWYAIGRKVYDEVQLTNEYTSLEELKKQICDSNTSEADLDFVNGIGIGFARINGKIYWLATVARVKI